MASVHSVVHYDPGYFCGWPANVGMWDLGSRLLVGFERGTYRYKERGHSIDPESEKTIRFCESTDSGESWELKPEMFFSQPSKLTLQISGRTSYLKHNGRTHLLFYRLQNSRGPTVAYVFHSDFWHGPCKVHENSLQISGRTSYLKHNGRTLWFTSAAKEDGREGQTYCAELGLGSEIIGEIGEMPTRGQYRIMPSGAALGDDLFCATRVRLGGPTERTSKRNCRIEMYMSSDGGFEWTKMPDPVEDTGRWGNPPALVEFYGWLALFYCRRILHGQSQLCVKLSKDGVDWTDERILRSDGWSWDVGYPVAKSKGCHVTVCYYWSTAERKEQHIACTRFQ